MLNLDFPFGKVRVGQTAKENWQIFEEAQPNHMWFHLDKLTSCHIICDNNDLNSQEISVLANLCKEHSKFKYLKNLKICYCEIGNLKKGGKEGELIINSNHRVKILKI